MEQLTTDIVKYLLAQGVLGLVVILLIAAVVYMRREMREMQERYNDLQEKRLKDAQVASDRLLQMSKEVDANVDKLATIADNMITKLRR